MATTDSNNQDNVWRPSMIEMIKDSIDRKSKNLRRIFLNWDHDQDGFIDATEMRKGQFSDAWSEDVSSSCFVRTRSCLAKSWDS